MPPKDRLTDVREPGAATALKIVGVIGVGLGAFALLAGFNDSSGVVLAVGGGAIVSSICYIGLGNLIHYGAASAIRAKEANTQRLELLGELRRNNDALREITKGLQWFIDRESDHSPRTGQNIPRYGSSGKYDLDEAP